MEKNIDNVIKTYRESRGTFIDYIYEQIKKHNEIAFFESGLLVGMPTNNNDKIAWIETLYLTDENVIATSIYGDKLPLNEFPTDNLFLVASNIRYGLDCEE